MHVSGLTVKKMYGCSLPDASSESEVRANIHSLRINPYVAGG